MSLKHRTIVALVRPYTAHEMPGWGWVYRSFVGTYQHDAFWAGQGDRIFRDKRYGLLRRSDLHEWSDRFHYFLNRWYDLETQLMAEALIRPGDTVIDVGANYGHFTLAAAALVGPQGRVHAFEPNPASFERLTQHVTLNALTQVETHSCGVADIPGELTLCIPPDHAGEASFADTGHAGATTTVCPVTTLDIALGDTDVAMVKIDVEGFEVNVLAGADALLKRCRPFVLTEVVEAHLSRACTSPAALFEVFAAHGYRAARLGLVRRGLRHELQLAKADRPGPDGEYVWLPEERAGAIMARFR